VGVGVGEGVGVADGARDGIGVEMVMDIGSAFGVSEALAGEGVF
jgi:hypothetical protein